MSYGGEYDSVEDLSKMNSNSGSGNPSSLNLETLNTVPRGVSGKKVKKDKPVLSAAAKERKILSSIRSFVIVLALSIHSVFEGMAIGKFLTLNLRSQDDSFIGRSKVHKKPRL